MVKLVDFNLFPEFNSLREQMGASLLSSFSFQSGISLLEDDELRQLGQDGVEALFEEISIQSDETLSYKGQRVLLYIRDVSLYGGRISLPKFHVSFCRTLEGMWKKKRKERYVVANNDSGLFRINIIRDGKPEINYETLGVCKNCLDHLNWQEYSSQIHKRNSIASKFSITDFFKIYPKALISVKPDHNADTAPLNVYSSDWSQISQRKRKEVNGTCQQCSIVLAGTNLKYLHVHHIDGIKSNNSDGNLMALCVKCHAEQPGHSHMLNSPEYSLYKDKVLPKLI